MSSQRQLRAWRGSRSLETRAPGPQARGFCYPCITRDAAHRVWHLNGEPDGAPKGGAVMGGSG